MQLMLWVLRVTPVPMGKALWMKHSCCQGEPLNAFLAFGVADDMRIVKQMFVWFCWRIVDWTWQTFCHMPITDSISQLVEWVSFVFGRLCQCHSVIALGGHFSWNWSKVAVNRDLLNVARAVWFPVFRTCHWPHHVSGVRWPGNGSLFFRWIVYAIYSGSCLIPLRGSPSATAMKRHVAAAVVRDIIYGQPINQSQQLSENLSIRRLNLRDPDRHRSSGDLTRIVGCEDSSPINNNVTFVSCYRKPNVNSSNVIRARYQETNPAGSSHQQIPPKMWLGCG